MSNVPSNTAFLLVVALGLATLPLLVPHPDGSELTRTLADAGHAPLFGLVALLVLRIVSRRRGASAMPLRTTYGAAFAVAALLGVVSEAAQFVVARDASGTDVLRNLAGVTAFLMVALAFDRSRKRALAVSRARRVGLVAGGVATLLAVAFPPASVALAIVQRDAAMPRLCDFESRWSSRFWKLRQAELHVTEAPAAWTGRSDPERARGRRVARIDFQPGTYPGFTIDEASPDWSRYETLAFDVFSELDSTIRLVLRIDDAHAYLRYEDRFNRGFVVEPGVNHVRVPLSDVMAGPRDRTLDLTRVRRLVLFAVRPPRAFSLYVDDFRLE